MHHPHVTFFFFFVHLGHPPDHAPAQAKVNSSSSWHLSPKISNVSCLGVTFHRAPALQQCMAKDSSWSSCSRGSQCSPVTAVNVSQCLTDLCPPAPSSPFFRFNTHSCMRLFLFCIFLPLWLLCLPHDLPSGPKEQIKWEIVLKTSQFTSPRWGKCHCSGDQCLIPLQLLRSAFWALERFFPHTGEKMLMDIFIEGRLGKAICLLSFQNILFSFSFAVPPNVTSFLTCSSNHLLQL